MHNQTSPRTDDSAIESEILERADKAPRVMPADIEASIASEHYFVAAEAAFHAPGSVNISNGCGDLSGLGLLTFCVLVLRNGYTVTGESACASAENFDAEIGRKIARQNAVNKIWPLLGFRLRDRLSTEAKPAAALDCPHAVPHRYCATCVADPCPIGLGKG